MLNKLSLGVVLVDENTVQYGPWVAGTTHLPFAFPMLLIGALD